MTKIVTNSKTKYFIIFIVSIIFVSACKQNNNKEYRQTETLTWEVTKIYSQILKDTIELRIYSPQSNDKPIKQYPVLYITPNWQPYFYYASGLIKFLSDIKKIPEMIIVSVDCKRWRDMIPSAVKNHGDNTGNADNYLEFMEKELFPNIEKKYQASSERILWSHSIGGVFGLYTLCSKPELFQTIIASSPYQPYELNEDTVVKYQEKTILHEKGFILKNMGTLLDKRTTQKNFLFMIVGNEPELIPYFDETVKILETKSPKGLTWKTSKWLNENHQSMLTYSLQAGLLARYADRKFE